MVNFAAGNFPEAPEFRVVNFAANLKSEISHTGKFTAPKPPPPCNSPPQKHFVCMRIVAPCEFKSWLFFFAHPPVQRTALSGERNHGKATVRNDLPSQSVRGVNKRSLKFPALVHWIIRVCLLAMCQLVTLITALPHYCFTLSLPILSLLAWPTSECTLYRRHFISPRLLSLLAAVHSDSCFFLQWCSVWFIHLYCFKAFLVQACCHGCAHSAPSSHSASTAHL